MANSLLSILTVLCLIILIFSIALIKGWRPLSARVAGVENGRPTQPSLKPSGSFLPNGPESEVAKLTVDSPGTPARSNSPPKSLCERRDLEIMTRDQEETGGRGKLQDNPQSQGVRPAKEASDEYRGGYETLFRIETSVFTDKDGGIRATIQVLTPRGEKSGKKPWFPPPSLVENLGLKLLEGFRSPPQDLVSGSKAKPKPSGERRILD